MKRFIGMYLAYAVVVGMYLFAAMDNTVPEAYRGTPLDPQTFMTADQVRDSAVYSTASDYVFFLLIPLEWGLLLWLLASGRSSRWLEAMRRRGVPGWMRVPVFVFAVTLVTHAGVLPLRFIAHRLARHYGISNQTVVDWLRDKLITYAIDSLILLVAASVALWVMRQGGRWWLRLWILSVPFALFLIWAQPVLIDPLYNKVAPMTDHALEQEILTLAGKADIPADRVYVAEMAERTNAVNAYVNGLGTSLRIVLWDTALNRLDRPEILLIMAHEMAHYVKHHLEWSAVGSVATSLVVLWLAGRWYPRIVRRVGPAFGIRHFADWQALPLILLLLSIASFAALPFSNAVSRQAEASADRYALELMNSTEGAYGHYQKLAVSSLDDVHPPLLVRLIRSSHPSIFERMKEVQQYERQLERSTEH